MKVTRASISVLAVLAAAILPAASSQCLSLSTSFTFEADDFFPDPNELFYNLESELFLDATLASITEVNVNFSSTVASGGAMVTIEYLTSDLQGVSFTYDNRTVGCTIPNDVVCDLGKLGIFRDKGSSSPMLNPSLALAALALYTQDMPFLATASVLLAPRLVAAQTCTDRLVITITLADIDNTVGVTPTVLTDSVKFLAACTGGNAACNNNILTGCAACV